MIEPKMVLTHYLKFQINYKNKHQSHQKPQLHNFLFQSSNPNKFPKSLKNKPKKKKALN